MSSEQPHAPALPHAPAQPAAPQVRATATSVWPGADPREGASAGVSELSDGHPPLTLASRPAAGGTRWAFDAVGFGASLLADLPTDLGSFGWRLARGHGRDRRIEHSHLGQAIDAAEEYTQGFAGRMSLTLLGPWTLMRHLSLPDGNPVLGDPGAIKDVLQAYTGGIEALLGRLVRALGQQPRVLLVETALDEILTGSVPTVSGYKTLAALPDAFVTAGLRSFLKRTGEDTIVWLPAIRFVTIAGKKIAHTTLLMDMNARALCAGLSRVDAAVVRGFEQYAAWQEAGNELWFHPPASAGDAPGEVQQWIDAIITPWRAVGIPAAGLAEVGIVGGVSLPPAAHPLLEETDTPNRVRGSFQLAARLAAALQEQQ